MIEQESDYILYMRYLAFEWFYIKEVNTKMKYATNAY